MADSDLVRQASDELYSTDPDEFVERRRALADEARQSGQPAAAKQITALRKPTRSAWTLNVLARTEPALIDDVLGLGEQMREAERRLDGAQLRDLSKQRRQLINTLSRKAFAASKQSAPSAALREEVSNTLSAAFADPDLAELLQSGTVLKSAQWDGFGSGIRPDLSLVPPPAKREPAKKAAKRASPPPAKAPTAAERRAAERALENERRARHREQVAAAKKHVAEARRTLATAEAAERDRREQLRELKSQVADMQHSLDEARLQAGRAKSDLRKAEQALDRAQR